MDLVHNAGGGYWEAIIVWNNKELWIALKNEGVGGGRLGDNYSKIHHLQ